MTHMKMGGGVEFDRIRMLATELGRTARDWGDDVAVVSCEGGEHFVSSVDLSVENVHFRRSWLLLEEIGWRSATSALSDLAAAGAAPVGLLVSVGMPETFTDDNLASLMRGVGEAADAVGAQILGGDLSQSERIVLDCCVIGRVQHLVQRAGAAPGHQIWVTGQFGGPAAAVRAWMSGAEPEPAHRARFVRPDARIAAGQWLAQHGATAMIDISDGFVADAAHMAAASDVKITLELDRLPLIDGVGDPLVAAGGGEEYELLAALPSTFDERSVRDAPVLLTKVGRCDVGSGVETHLAGRPVSVAGGYDHFAQ